MTRSSSSFFQSVPGTIISPPDLGDLEQWYNDDSFDSVVPKFGNIFGVCNDLSGNGRDLFGGISVLKWPVKKDDGPNGHSYMDMFFDSYMFGENFSSLNNAVGYTLFTVYRTNPNTTINGYLQAFVNSTEANASHYRLSAFALHAAVHRRITGDTVAQPFSFVNKAVQVFGYDIAVVDPVNQTIDYYPGGVFSIGYTGQGTAGNMEASDAATYHVGRLNQGTTVNTVMGGDFLEWGVYSKALTALEIASLKLYIDDRYSFTP